MRHHRWDLNDGDLHNFEVLPAKLTAQYPGSGIRPDLLFTGQRHEMRTAGEGRSVETLVEARVGKAAALRLQGHTGSHDRAAAR